MRNILIRSTASLAFALQLTRAAGAQQPVVHYEPAVTTLSGTVTIDQHYGPPNFGASPKTDLVENVPVLVLGAPVTAQGNPRRAGDRFPIDTTTFSNVRRIQLVFTTPGARPSLLAGKHVTATGTLFEKLSGENFTDVLMSVQEVVPAQQLGP